ncbi:MAG: hypothetical protein QOJ20_2819 [Mycobacterium sp.]|nr:hypothetical protein [Mycobacterium sp.]
MWKIAADDGSVCVGFALADDADVGAYQRCNSYRLDTTAAQATVWMADDVQYELTGYEFVQWPIAGRRILVPPLADAQWAKQHLARATMALPNGYCGLPLQQSCPHANA